jgi:hypothetical protein
MVCERLNIRQNGQLEPKKHNFGRKSIKQISGFAPYHRFLMIYARHDRNNIGRST